MGRSGYTGGRGLAMAWAERGRLTWRGASACCLVVDDVPHMQARHTPNQLESVDCTVWSTFRRRMGPCSQIPSRHKESMTRHLSKSLAFAFLCTGVAGQEVYPLLASAVVGTHVEGVAPFLLPERCVQTKLTDRHTLQALQSLPQAMNVWDMITIGPNSRYVFVPCERSPQAGVFRYDMATGDVDVMMHGSGGARTADPSQWNASTDEFVRLDPTRLTPWGTLITAEEETGGRLFEIMNPFAAGGFQVEWRSRFPAVKHEGIAFDTSGALYFVDESNSGSIYKFVPHSAGDLSTGQSFVLSVDAYAADPAARPAESWSSSQNQLTTRVGAATWVPMTNPVGNPVTVIDPFVFVTQNSGRLAADELLATPFGRPEDMEIGTLANGNQCLYVALSSEDSVLSVELTGGTSAMVRYFVSPATTDIATGNAIGADLRNPDNLARDAFGQIYVVEDYVPGDIFKCQDVDGDGVAESLGRIASMDVAGAEPSGLIFDPNDPYLFYCTVMHPSSGNDAIWSVQTRPYPGDGDPWLLASSSTAPNEPLRSGVAEFVDAALPNDIATIAVDPTPVLIGNPFVIIAEPFVTALGAPGFLSPIWIDPGAALLLASGSVGTLPPSPPYGGNAVSLPVPPGLQGLSVLAQGVVLEPNFGLIWSDGIELILK